MAQCYDSSFDNGIIVLAVGTWKTLLIIRFVSHVIVRCMKDFSRTLMRMKAIKCSKGNQPCMRAVTSQCFGDCLSPSSELIDNAKDSVIV
jgi:hypothetical protein